RNSTRLAYVSSSASRTCARSWLRCKPIWMPSSPTSRPYTPLGRATALVPATPRLGGSYDGQEQEAPQPGGGRLLAGPDAGGGAQSGPRADAGRHDRDGRQEGVPDEEGRPGVAG